MSTQTVYNFSANDIKGNEVSLADYRGKVLLIVNTASKCGFTPQFEGLEALHKELGGRGFEVLGFPCNQFLNQDPGNNDRISEFCSLNYGVTFPMFAKIEVNGDGTHPLFQFLKKQAKGLMGSEKVKWNFTKFLVDKNGNVVERYAPTTDPMDIAKDIE
ncbi:MAG: glutathione peroxidase, partial [Marinobacter sp. 34-60-7]